MREDNICIWVSDDSDGIRPPPCLSLNKIKKAISWVPLQLQLVANENLYSQINHKLQWYRDVTT
jgi:hypothetical protein